MKKPEPLKREIGYTSDWTIRKKGDIHPSGRTKVLEAKDVQAKVDEVFAWVDERIEKHRDCTRYQTIDKHLCIDVIKKDVDEAHEVLSVERENEHKQ